MEIILRDSLTSDISSRAPYVWLKDRRSILDLVGKGFKLLNLSNKKAHANALTTAARKVGMPLEVVALDDPNGRDICELRFVLVRPTVTLRGVATRCPTTQPRSSIRCAALRSRRNE